MYNNCHIIIYFSFYREKHAVSMKTLLNCSDKDYTNWRELEQISNAELNNLEMKLTSLETNISECNQNLVQKQKVCIILLTLFDEVFCIPDPLKVIYYFVY